MELDRSRRYRRYSLCTITLKGRSTKSLDVRTEFEISQRSLKGWGLVVRVAVWSGSADVNAQLSPTTPSFSVIAPSCNSLPGVVSLGTRRRAQVPDINRSH